MRINFYLLLVSCGGSEYQLDAGSSSCPDVYVTCPDPIVNVTSDSLNISCPDVSCPDPIVEVVIEQDCPILECPDVSCPTPVTEVVVSNDIDTQPIADEIANIGYSLQEGSWYTIYFPNGTNLSWLNSDPRTYVIDRAIGSVNNWCVDLQGNPFCKGHYLGIQDTHVFSGDSIYDVTCESIEGCVVLGRYFNY